MVGHYDGTYQVQEGKEEVGNQDIRIIDHLKTNLDREGRVSEQEVAVEVSAATNNTNHNREGRGKEKVVAAVAPPNNINLNREVRVLEVAMDRKFLQ